MKEANEQESSFVFCGCFYGKVDYLQVYLRGAYGLHVPHFIISVSCSVGHWSGLGLDSVSPCLGLGLVSVSTPQCLGLVLLWIHYGLGLGLGGLDYNTAY